MFNRNGFTTQCSQQQYARQKLKCSYFEG